MSPSKRIVVTMALGACLWNAVAQAATYDPGLPSGFPAVNVAKNATPTPGVFIGSVAQGASNTYYVILDNSGYPLYYSKTQTLSSFIQPNGLIAIAAGGAFDLKDETLTRVDTFGMTGGATVDTHDFKLLTNGHALLIGKEVRSIDVSRLVPIGRPDARVSGDVVQEVDANKQVVFEWHSFDDIPIVDSFYDLSQKTIDYAHINAISLDPLDNNLLVSLRTTSEIVKIDRSTGQVVWRLGGKGNMFTFIGEHEENAPYYTVGQHDVSRLANGDLLYFDNGNISGGGITPSDRTYSRAVEYRLDEVNRTATLMWEYRHTPDISAPCTGAARRFSNGNTLVQWGCAIATSGTIATEVSPTGQVVQELTFPSAGASASLMKQLWNRTDLVTSQTYSNVQAGQTCDATSTTGVSVTVHGVTGNTASNGLAIQKWVEAARFPRFGGKEPLLLVNRLVLTGYGITDADLDVAFNVTSMGGSDPTRLTVYWRPCPGQGEFTALATTYVYRGPLTVAHASLGEFVFGYPDAPDIPLAPTLRAPEDLGRVNQTQPVVFQWSPKGFGRSYQLQVATDAAFTTLVLDRSGITGTSATLATVVPGATYYWRVRTTNYGGNSEWASRSFTAAAPTVQVTVPNGGEHWQRGLKYFIQWSDNLSESVVIRLYKGSTLISTIATVSTDSAYQWDCPLSLAAGDDYSIRVESSANKNVADVSDGTFMIF